MEFHAFERMAQSMGASPAHMEEPPYNRCMQYEAGDCCQSELLMQPTTEFPDKTPPAMAYVPYQMWGEVYEAEKGFTQGTMFPVLDQPFHCAEGGCCK